MSQRDENELIDLDDLLANWPVHAVPRHLVPQEAHHHSVEFKKQSGASPDQIDDLLARHNDGADLDRYFEKRVEALELDWEEQSPRRDL